MYYLLRIVYLTITTNIQNQQPKGRGEIAYDYEK